MALVGAQGERQVVRQEVVREKVGAYAGRSQPKPWAASRRLSVGTTGCGSARGACACSEPVHGVYQTAAHERQKAYKTTATTPNVRATSTVGVATPGTGANACACRAGAMWQQVVLVQRSAYMLRLEFAAICTVGRQAGMAGR